MDFSECRLSYDGVLLCMKLNIVTDTSMGVLKHSKNFSEFFPQRNRLFTL